MRVLAKTNVQRGVLQIGQHRFLTEETPMQKFATCLSFKDEAEEAKMTAEKREAERRVAKIFGEIQQEVNTRLAAKDAAKEASKKSGRK